MVSDITSHATGAPPVQFAHAQANATQAPRGIERSDHAGEEETRDEYLDRPAGPVVQLVRDSERSFREINQPEDADLPRGDAAGADLYA